MKHHPRKEDSVKETFYKKPTDKNVIKTLNDTHRRFILSKLLDTDL